MVHPIVKPTLRPARLKSQTLTQVVIQELRDAIEGGVYAPGSQLPPELELVQMLGVSRTVVREALRFLDEEGLVVRRQGLGTFVRKNPILQNLNLNYGTTEMIKTAGLTSGTPFVHAAEVEASGDVAKALNLKPGAHVLAIERVRSADAKPVVYSLDYMDRALVAEGDFSRFQQGQDVSLYQLIENDMGLLIEYGVARILPVKASPRVAEMLRVTPGSPLLCMLQTDYAPDESPVLYSCEYHLPDAFDFIVIRRGPRKGQNPFPPSEGA